MTVFYGVSAVVLVLGLIAGLLYVGHIRERNKWQRARARINWAYLDKQGRERDFWYWNSLNRRGIQE